MLTTSYWCDLAVVGSPGFPISSVLSRTYQRSSCGRRGRVTGCGAHVWELRDAGAMIRPATFFHYAKSQGRLRQHRHMDYIYISNDIANYKNRGLLYVLSIHNNSFADSEPLAC